ncbi:MAG: serine hydrolase [Candidatus Saccharimonadales bacterium]
MLRHVKHTARRVHHHINRHALWWVVFLALSLIVGLQVAYPLDRAVPFARLGGKLVGYQKFDTIAESINKSFLETKVTLYISPQISIPFSPRQAGADVDLDAMSARLTDYPLWARLIPFSFVAFQPDVQAIDLSYNGRQMDEFMSSMLPRLNVPPRDAGMTIRDGQLTVTDDVPGREVTADNLRKTLATARYGLISTTLTVPSKELSAAKPRAYFETVKQQAEAVIALPITIGISDETRTPSRADIASWLAVGEVNAQAALTVNDAGIDAYLSSLRDAYTTPAGQTEVTRVDGREIARVEGASGRSIDVAALRAQLSDIVRSGRNQPVQATFVSVPPTVVINKKYSSTEAGLQAYVSDQATSRNVRITVQQIGGANWSASARGSESTVSASTYKLFVALYLFHLMDEGKLSWDDAILDTNVRGCFERMLVASTNACAEEWLRRYGDDTVEQYAWSRGFSRGTQFTNPEANHTTTDDLTRFMRGLNDGSLLSGEQRDYVLSALIRHPYRKGIPGGSGGEVHNKVGFLWDYSNDSAVVYHPRGTYVIAVMTKGLSFYAIAGITREIEAIMYP